MGEANNQGRPPSNSDLQTIVYNGQMAPGSIFPGKIVEYPTKLIFRKQIGAGGLGQIWRGEKMVGKSSKVIAIKVPFSELRAIEALRGEADLASKLYHPNIAQIGNLIETPEGPLIEMEYVAGSNLRELSTTHEEANLLMADSLAALIGLFCCRGLDYAHNRVFISTEGRIVRGLIHRDITPANIMVTDSGDVKLIDFGVGILESDKMSQSGISGTTAYLSPEMLEKGMADARSDIYGLGISLYESLAGISPFGAIVRNSRDFETARPKVLERQRKGIKNLAQIVEIDEKLAGILEKSMKRNPDERYQTSAEFSEALREYMFKGYGPSKEGLESYLKILNRFVSNMPISDKEMQEAKKNIPFLIKNGEIYFKPRRYKPEAQKKVDAGENPCLID